MESPPDKPRAMTTNIGPHSKFVTKPYCRGIAVSEPVLNIDGEAYWEHVASADMLRRLVHVLAATDSETRLGASMILTKFCDRT